MTPERWIQLDELFQAAVELEPGRRPAFLDEVCAGDQVLRSQLTTMLAADDRGWDLMEQPALEVLAPLLADEQPQLSPDQRLGHYEIVRLIGRGGMGEVYLARDGRLNRRIALKLLPIEYTRNKDRLRRFEQEAQSASALNHPNILTIYEIGQVDDQRFIATEFVEGETLRERVKRGELVLTETLDIVIQVAGALEAAHNAGIVHRDIKPENIMLRPDGYVKVVDFGLAKLTEQYDRTAAVQSDDNVDTSSGLFMGTVKYMSPEQAGGLQVDPRSDIFSLGVVLYEMLTGRAPFEGKTSSDLIESILQSEPPSLASHAPIVPDKLDLIVTKTLRKSREERYQAARGLLIELKELREELELESKFRRAAESGLLTRATFNEGDSPAPTETADQPAATNRPIENVSVASLTRSFIGGIAQHKVGSMLVLIALAIALGSIPFLPRKWFSRRSAPFQEMRISQIAGTQYSGYGAISPDGKSLALVVDDQGQNGLWIRRLGTNDQREIVPPAPVVYIGLTFSLDSSHVYYVSGKLEFATALYEVSAAGGESRRVLGDVHGPITFSPDGGRFGFVRVGDGGRTTTIVVANTDGSGERELARRQYPEAFTHAAPSWSPDGGIIACPASHMEGARYSNVVQVHVDTGVEQPISSNRWGAVEQVAWLSDGTGLMMLAAEKLLGPTQLWHLSYPEGELRRITNDLSGYARLTLSASSKSMITLRMETRASIWQAPEHDAGRANQITDETSANILDVSCLPDGRLVFTSTVSGDREIWIINADGSGLKQLTADGYQKFWPSASADGKYIVFSSRGSDAHHIWRMEIDGSNPRQLTSGVAENYPSCSPDGWVVYASGRPGETSLWKVPIQGGKPVQITDKASNFPRVSPDGKLIACRYKNSTASGWKIAIIPFDGSPRVRTFDIPSNDFRWMPDGRTLNYIVTRNRVSNLWSQPIDGGDARQVTNFNSLRMYAFDWTREGTLIASRGFRVSDIVLITDAN